ncbi:MAG: diaminopimelate epimerase [Thermoguttaceae bacterium]
MRFTKMQGAGNDYIFVDCFAEHFPPNASELARKAADRHFGVGGDGLIFICPSQTADARMRMFNLDGTESEMCGNGVRCVAKYVYDHGICRRSPLRIETGRGVLTLELELAEERVRRVRVDMGEPILEGERIPTTIAGNSPWPGNPVVEAEMKIGAKKFNVTCVSMGNPHCVAFVRKPSDSWALKIGPRVEMDPRFPNRTNVEFVKVLSPGEVLMRVWERGSGETLACGTGACAVCVAGVLTNRTERKITAHLPGGDLKLFWNPSDNHVYLSGDAVEVFSGEWSF